ncbi:MAG: hypothetical protein ACRC0S_03410 [Fusobacteriaceae bacterium]
MVITEYLIKTKLKNSESSSFILEKGMILTPSAKQYLSDKGIFLIKEEEEIKEKKEENEELKKNVDKPKFRGLSGEYYYEKPENMTHLSGNILVSKLDKRIVLRGKIDSFLAQWCIVQKKLLDRKNQKLSLDLESVFHFIKKIMISEIENNELPEVTVLGYTFDQIRDISHNPKQNFGLEHLFDINSSYEDLILELNLIRAKVREIELLAVEVFLNNNGAKEEKIVKAFNRMSSIIYIMMLKSKAGIYGKK